MRRDHKTISPTAFNHIIFRTFYGIPLAEEFEKAAEKYRMREYLFNSRGIHKKISPMFEGRYKGGEEVLEKFIKRNRDCTILELAAGFSLHGANLARKYPKINYIETDLSDIIKMKEKIVKEIGLNLPNLSFKSANALDAASVKKIISRSKFGSKVAIYCEGLLSYFDDKEKIKIAKIIKSVFEERGGVWITPDPALSAEARKYLRKDWTEYRQAMKNVEKMAKQKYDDHGFKSEKETDKLFRNCGFAIRKYNWPTKLISWQTSGYDQKRMIKLGSILKKFGKTWVMTIKK
ncbi:MAG: class I SAM-dependent methyltransferase [Candidatus Moranbacteria bacterium]|nr:class I SAM-dependent methyltransferase [Candidatus Moranbacteria bacterium]